MGGGVGPDPREIEQRALDVVVGDHVRSERGQRLEVGFAGVDPAREFDEVGASVSGSNRIAIEARRRRRHRRRRREGVREWPVAADGRLAQ